MIFLGPPGTGKTHLAAAMGMKGCLAGHRVQFATATQWVMRLATANHEQRLETYLRLLERTPLIIIDEVGYIPLDAEAANLPALGRRHTCSSSSSHPATTGAR